MTQPDPVDLTRRLIRCASITPEDAGAIPILEEILSRAGFECRRADRGGIANLVARFGPKDAARSFGFNGHTDVVPPGNPDDWTHPPFAGELVDGVVWGRGAADMKSGVAAFVAAACRVAARGAEGGAIVVTVTGDEEGEADHGTLAIIDHLRETGTRMDVCVVGEPTSGEALGDTVKIGRRGSMNARFVASGVQGHSAYPHAARNPVHALVTLLEGLIATPLDEGSEHFDPSTLAVTSFDVGNAASNVIPARAEARLNIRFNDLHEGAGLATMLRERAAAVAERSGVGIEVAVKISGESFLTEPGPLSRLAQEAVRKVTGREAALSTSGGTSDARFIRALCPVVELGLTNATIHQVDERVPADEIEQLADVYEAMLTGYFRA